MGNNVQVQGGTLFSNPDFLYHVQLGRHAAIDVTKTEAEKEQVGGSEDLMEWNVSYTIDESICELNLKIYLGKGRKANLALFSLHDGTCSEVGSYFATKDLLKAPSVSLPGEFRSLSDRTIHAWGCVTQTLVHFYGSGNKGGLVVWERKKKNSGDENPYMVTVTHYYATSKGDMFDQTRMDIGLSVAVKFTASNDMGFNFMVEGPTQHPAAALFYMFDEVKRTGNWKPTACPHCATIQKQQRTSMFSQSESEDSDNFPPAQQPRGTRPNAGSSVIANDATVKGNYNGSLFVRRIMNRFVLR